MRCAIRLLAQSTQLLLFRVIRVSRAGGSGCAVQRLLICVTCVILTHLPTRQGIGLLASTTALDRATRHTRYTPLARPVRWQSGDAADCKSANVGSIPARTSSLSAGFSAKTWVSSKSISISSIRAGGRGGGAAALPCPRFAYFEYIERPPRLGGGTDSGQPRSRSVQVLQYREREHRAIACDGCTVPHKTTPAPKWGEPTVPPRKTGMGYESPNGPVRTLATSHSGGQEEQRGSSGDSGTP